MDSLPQPAESIIDIDLFNQIVSGLIDGSLEVCLFFVYLFFVINLNNVPVYSTLNS